MIKRPDHEIFVKVGAYIIIGLAFLSLIGGGLGSASIWILFSYGSMIKKVGASLGILVAGALIFFLLLAFYEFLMEFLSLEEEVEELEKRA